MEGHQGHVCQTSLSSFVLRSKGKRIEQRAKLGLFSLPVGGAESSAIGRPLNTQKMHHDSVTTDLQREKKSHQPCSASEREKKSLETSPLVSEELGSNRLA
jgi:hypothetical protein